MMKLEGSVIQEKNDFGNACKFNHDYNSKSDFFENNEITIIIYGRVSVFDKEINLQTLKAHSLYIEYMRIGVEVFSKFDGNYLLTIYDKKKNKVYLLRDFFGKWPMYYYQSNDGFFYSSSLKSLQQNNDFDFTISKEALSLYFQLTYIPSPYCIYENVCKLEANHYLEFDCKKNKYTINEIDQSANFYNKDYCFNDAKKIVHDKVFESVDNNILNNNSIGSLLSGGVDSSIVSFCYSKLTSIPVDTFSLGFDNKNYDETNKSKIVANLIGSKHYEFILQPQDIVHELDEIITSFDEPFADSSAIPSYYIASKASEKVNSVLTGDGGDEVFGGYNKYYMGNLNRNYTHFFYPKMHNKVLHLSNSFLTQKSDNRGVIYKLNRLLNSIDYEGDFYYNIISLGFKKEEIKELLVDGVNSNNSFEYFKKRMCNKSDTIHDFRKIDKMISLEGDMIVKVSKTSDLSNIETHSPLLSKELWQFSNSLSESFLMKGWNKKYILKEAFKEYFPKNFFESSKKGFGVPVGDWLRRELKDELLYYCNRSLLKKQGIFNLEYVNKLVSNHINSVEDNTFKVWSFFCFQKWYFNMKLNKK